MWGAPPVVADQQTLLAASGLDLAGTQVGAQPGAELSVDVGPVVDGAFLDVGVLDAADGTGSRVERPGLGAVVEDFAVQRGGLAEVAGIGAQRASAQRPSPGPGGVSGSTAAGPPREFGAWTGMDWPLNWYHPWPFWL